ncbi:6843_t:CDS:1 [Paraglomus occultum]|uniref:6843_t:CDS:1 n=1 Tax=Paraglomus occultum TaxID=144539 RepID=A0A9N9BMA2_9GLOM|nr:6843_t:CDS:1 [Paraglomus occultum]
MRFTTIISTLLIGSSLLFSSTQACEAECQKGISKAFGDKYGDELKPFFDRFKTDLTNTILQGVDFDDVGEGSKLQKAVPDVAKSKVDQLETEFVGSLQQLAFKSIFVQNPRYKGDCNHPKLVKQPKKGVPWARSDCDKQTYLCGNPPAICHDIQKIKNRIFTNIQAELTKLASNTGAYFTALDETVSDTARAVGVSLKKRKKFLMPTVDSNIQNALSRFLDDIESKFCHDTCSQYDDPIIDLLLQFP